MKVARQTTFILTLVIAIFAWAALTYPGYFELEHGFRPIFNLTDLAGDPLAIGWAPMVGQPYDLLRGEGALPYRLALLLRALTGSSAAAMRWFFVATILAGTIGMYAWAQRALGEWPALIAAAVYALWPAGLATIYVRGAPAEATFLAVMPWILWAVHRAAAGAAADENLTPGPSPTRRGADAAPPSLVGKGAGGLGAIFRTDAIAALGLAALIWTHAGLSLWFAVVMIGATIFTTDENLTPGPSPTRRGADATPPSLVGKGAGGLGALARKGAGGLGAIFKTLWPVLAGLALGAAGLLPVVLRHGLIGKTHVNFADHFVSPHLFLWPGWNAGTGMIAPSPELSFQWGLVACALATLGLLLPRASRLTPDVSRLTFDVSRLTPDVSRFALSIVLLTAFLSSTLAVPLWRLLSPLQGTLAGPGQLLLLAGPWLAWLAGAGGRALFERLPAERQEGGVPLVAACLLALILLGSYGYLRPAPVPAPIPDAALAIFGDNEIALLEATPTILPPRGATEPLLQAGATISVTVRWQALRPLERDYTVFLHLVDANGQLQGQQDTMPRDNKLPTTQWRPGQIITDQYHATLKPGAPAGGNYRFYLGLYLWQTGERLRVGTDDKVLIKP